MIITAAARTAFSLCVLTTALWMGGCSSLPKQVERPESHAILDTAQTRLGRALGPELAAHPDLSGYHPLAGGVDALVARIALARAAERTLDVQYYTFHADDIGAALLNELLAAADRGVRVRLLLDDIHTAGLDDVIAQVNSHPNVEVRLFNPFAHRGARWMDFLTDFSRVNRRMHNKSMTADSQATVVGGRNIGEQYFNASPDLEFSDFDVLAIGPVVARVSAEFDNYWNSDVVYPFASLHPGSATAAAGEPQVLLKLEERIEALRTTPYASALRAADLAQSIERRDVSLYWGGGTVISDQPDKVRLPTEESSTHAMPKLGAVLGQSKRELILISPYFVPGKEGMRWLEEIAGRGVHIIILTNSFAATDVKTVHSGYSSYRKAVLRAGIDLYELKPSMAGKPEHEHKAHSSKSSRASLHAKTYMSDAATLFVGSMNLDPRSARLNTEMGIVIDSESLSSHVRDEFLARLPDRAYHVEFDTGAREGKLVWITRENGRELRLDAEPDLGFFDKFMQGLQRLLPIEDQL
jgi:cardiolipin synthase C